MDNIVKICECKILISDAYCDKAKYIRDNEEIKSIKTRKMERFCYKQVEQYALEIQNDCNKYICKQ